MTETVWLALIASGQAVTLAYVAVLGKRQKRLCGDRGCLKVIKDTMPSTITTTQKEAY